MPISLLNLPAEIRLSIYEYMWDPLPNPERENHGQLRAMASPGETSKQLRPLLTCRQIYDEAYKIAYSRVTFFLIAKCSNVPWLAQSDYWQTPSKVLRPAQRAAIRSVAFPAGGHFNYFTEIINDFPGLKQMVIVVDHCLLRLAVNHMQMNLHGHSQITQGELKTTPVKRDYLDVSRSKLQDQEWQIGPVTISKSYGGYFVVSVGGETKKKSREVFWVGGWYSNRVRLGAAA